MKFTLTEKEINNLDAYDALAYYLKLRNRLMELENNLYEKRINGIEYHVYRYTSLDEAYKDMLDTHNINILDDNLEYIVCPSSQYIIGDNYEVHIRSVE